MYKIRKERECFKKRSEMGLFQRMDHESWKVQLGRIEYWVKLEDNKDHMSEKFGFFFLTNKGNVPENYSILNGENISNILFNIKEKVAHFHCLYSTQRSFLASTVRKKMIRNNRISPHKLRVT